jgi:preprotein translocase subunit SecG
MAVAAKIALAVISVILIVVVLLQSSKNAGLSGTVGGGAEHLMGKAKARGIDALLSRLTTIFAILFMIAALVVGYFVK